MLLSSKCENTANFMEWEDTEIVESHFISPVARTHGADKEEQFGPNNKQNRTGW